MPSKRKATWLSRQPKPQSSDEDEKERDEEVRKPFPSKYVPVKKALALKDSDEGGMGKFIRPLARLTTFRRKADNREEPNFHGNYFSRRSQRRGSEQYDVSDRGPLVAARGPGKLLERGSVHPDIWSEREFQKQLVDRRKDKTKDIDPEKMTEKQKQYLGELQTLETLRPIGPFLKNGNVNAILPDLIHNRSIIDQMTPDNPYRTIFYSERAPCPPADPAVPGGAQDCQGNLSKFLNPAHDKGWYGMPYNANMGNEYKGILDKDIQPENVPDFNFLDQAAPAPSPRSKPPAKKVKRIEISDDDDDGDGGIGGSGPEIPSGSKKGGLIKNPRRASKPMIKQNRPIPTHSYAGGGKVSSSAHKSNTRSNPSIPRVTTRERLEQFFR